MKDSSFGYKLQSYPITPEWIPGFLRDYFFLYQSDAGNFDGWWLRSWLSVEGYDYILLNGKGIDKYDLASLRNLVGPKCLGLYDVDVSPEDLESLNDVWSMDTIVIRGHWFTDTYIDRLLDLDSIKRVCLYETSVSDSGAEELVKHFGKTNCVIKQQLSNQDEEVFQWEFGLH